MAKRRTEEERRIIYKGAMNGDPLDEVNERLHQKGYRSCPQTTWKMVNNKEVPYFKKHPDQLEAFVKHPLPRSEF